MPKKNLRIFLGPAEIAKNNARLAKALREKGIKVTLVSRDLSPYQDGVTYDHVLKVQSRNRFIWALRYLYSSLYSLRFIWSHDVFIFIFGSSLLPYNLDLPILKLLGKKTIMRFVGSDIRHNSSNFSSGTSDQSFTFTFMIVILGTFEMLPDDPRIPLWVHSLWRQRYQPQ